MKKWYWRIRSILIETYGWSWQEVKNVRLPEIHHMKKLPAPSVARLIAKGKL